MFIHLSLHIDPYYHEKIACMPLNVLQTTWARILGLRPRGFFFHVCNSAMTNAVVFYQMRFCLVSCRDARDLQRSLGARIPKSPKNRSAEIPRILQEIPTSQIFRRPEIMERRPLSGNQRPDLLTSLMNMSLVPRLPRAMHLCRSSSNAGNVLVTATKPSRFAHLW